MNLLTLLKQKSGKVVFGTTQALVTSAAVGLFASYAAFTGGQIAAERESVRDLSSIGREDTVSSSGFRRSKSGMLTSINLKDGLNQVATAEERAALEGNGPANDFGLGNVDSINNLSFGSASQGGSTDGLGTGGVAATEMPTRSAVSSPYGGASGSGLAVTPSASSPAAAPTARLGTASMARASGNNLNASGPTSGSSASTRAGGSSSGGTGASAAPNYNFSGKMPSASSASAAVRMGNAANGSGSNFTRGGRDASSQNGGRYSPSMGNELRDISKRSAEVAGNKNRGANDGSDPFMAASTRSGGMTVSGEGALSEGVASSDFDNKQEVKLRGIQKWTADKQDDEAERSKARKTLLWLLLGSVAAVLAAAPIGYHLIKKGKNASPYGWGLVIAGFAVLAAAAALVTVMLVKAGQYHAKYSGGALPWLGYTVGALGFGLLTMAGIAGLSNKDGKFVKKYEKLIYNPLKKFAVNAGRTIGIQMATNTVTSELSRAMQDTGKKG